MLAAHYGEVVVNRLFPGTTQLATALPELVAAERTLELDTDKRARTIIHLEAGGRSMEGVNWLLRHGFAVYGKDYAGQRAHALGARGELAAVGKTPTYVRIADWGPKDSGLAVVDEAGVNLC